MKMTELPSRTTGSPWGSVLRFAALALLIGATSACDTLLEVELPGSITGDELNDPQLADIWRLSAMGRAECSIQAYIHWDDNDDIWWRAIGYQGGAWEYRDQPNTGTTCGRTGSSYSWYVPMQVARAENERVYDAYSGFSDAEVENREQGLAITAMYAGYMYQLLGERMCSLAVDLGPLMTSNEVEATAEEWFNTAIGHINATGDFSLPSTESMMQTVLLGRARARFWQDDYTGAAADATQIQPGFISWVTRDNSEFERRNHIWDYGYSSIQATVARPIIHPWGSPGAVQIPFTGYYDFVDGDNDAQGRPVVHFLAIDAEGRNNIDGFPIFDYEPGTTPDSARVRVHMTNLIVPGTSINVVGEAKYLAIDDWIPMARYEEAQLILADIAHANGDLPGAIGYVNAVRDAATPPLPHYTVASPTAQEVKDLIIEERRRALFLEGRFANTKIREDLWFPLGEGTVPTGYSYLDGTCMTMPDIEYELNPNLSAP
jgi:hypothetical protein